MFESKRFDSAGVIRSRVEHLVLLLRPLRDARPPLLAALVGLLVVQAALPAASALATAALVARVQSHPGADLFDAALVPLGVFGAVLLLGHVIEALSAPLGQLAGLRIDGAHRTRILRLTTAIPTIEALETPEVQQLIRRARAQPTNWTERTPADGALGRLRRLASLLGMVGACAVLAQYVWWAVPVLLVPGAVNQYLRNRQASAFTAVWRKGVEHGLRAEAWREALIAVGPSMEVRVFGFGEWMVGRIQQHLRAMFGPTWEASSRMLRSEWTQFLLFGAPLVVVYLAVAGDAAHGTVAVSALTAVLTAAWSLVQSLGYSEDVRNIRAATEGMLAYQELRELLGPAASAADADALPAPRAERRTEPPLVAFESVSFTYPGTERTVLNGLDLEIRPGELLAVVGLNGAGKSTMIKLLSGLYRPTGGRITADGTDVADLGVAAWRERVSVVFQDFVKYQLSAADNVTLGHATVPVDRAALAAAARDSGFDSVLERLPDGWDTPLARTRTGGVDLSGGQWQQAVLARALYSVHTGADLLVLDEPTAHLDVRTEFDVFRRLAEHRGRAGVVLISHRLSTVRQADRIVLLDGGRITESGTHDELMALGGRYAELFAIQAERFRLGYDDRTDESELL
ncbi:ABC transporter ATP-binding protein [Kitasatospora sp. NPDC058162]|uniref:ABC transporter ATP-binding protein n=1 Tax=Kitasatospora sp. NPDC058162 TaxID=3346362 RepID=UPI0036DB149A